MFYICKKLFSILSVSICIICCIPIYSDDMVSLFVGDKPFKEWFYDKENKKELKPIFKNDSSLLNFVIQDENEDIEIKKFDELRWNTYYYNKLDIENIKNILKINGDDFIILLNNVSYLYNKEDNYEKMLIAILLQHNDYKIIEIWHNNKNSIIDKTGFRLCRSKYFSVYKIDLKDLDFKMNEIKPVVPPVTTPVVPPEIKPVVPPVTTPVVQPEIKPVVPPVTTPVVQPEIKPVVIQPVPQVIKPVKNIDPGVSNKSNSDKSNSNNNNLCSCKK